jgi:hypothetical protein
MTIQWKNSRNFDSLKRKILTVWEGKFWQFPQHSHFLLVPYRKYGKSTSNSIEIFEKEFNLLSPFLRKKFQSYSRQFDVTLKEKADAFNPHHFRFSPKRIRKEAFKFNVYYFQKEKLHKKKS